MPDENPDILSDAVARNLAAVLSLPSAGMLRHHKSRLLTQSTEGVWVESAPGEVPLIDELIKQQTPVGISFKAMPHKATFASAIIRREPSFQINATSVVDALLLYAPQKIKPVQRRNNYRVHVPEGAPLTVRVWKIPDHVPVRDRPLASQMIAMTVRDLSVGGMGVTVSANPDRPRALSTDQRLRVEVKYEEIELILDGMLRLAKTDPANGAIIGGVQFKKLENDLAGRQAMAALTRIVGELQRDEVRRSRLGL